MQIAHRYMARHQQDQNAAGAPALDALMLLLHCSCSAY